MAGLKRCYKGQPGVADAVGYTAPAGGTAVRSIRVVNTDVVPRWIRIGTEGTSDADLLMPQVSIDAGGLLTENDLEPLEAGQTLHLRAEVAGKLTTHVGGYEMGT